MASWYRVIAVNEDKRPLDGVVIDAVDLTNNTVVGEKTTNEAGEALFTGLTGPQFFRPRVRRTAGSVGDRVYHGAIEIQIVGMSAGGSCYDAVVDPDGGGTHTKVEDAIVTALAASGNHYTILICDDVAMTATSDIGGIDKTIAIVGLSASAKQNIHSSTGADKWGGPVISAPSNTDMFKQASAKSGNDRGLIFSNVGLAGQDGEAILLVATADEIDFIEFDNCYFGLESSGGTYLVSNGLAAGTALGNIDIDVYNCGGVLAGFYENNSTPPDGLFAFDNRLTMTRWWTDGAGTGNQGNAADTSIVQGGYYVITNPMTVGAQGNNDQWEFRDFTLQTGCSGAAFLHAAADTNHKGVQYSNITFIATANDTDFGDFQGPSSNPQDNLYVVGIHGLIIAGVTPSGTFLTVDSDQTDPYVADIWAPDWGTVYSGPVITPAVPPVVDHGALTGLTDDDHVAYIRTNVGRATPNVVIGGTASGADLVLQSTSNATRGSIFAGGTTFEYDETSGQLKLTTTGSSAGLLIGSDVAMYRGAANALHIADDVHVPNVSVAGIVAAKIVL